LSLEYITLENLPIIALASIFAGALNAIAGGGTLISFPALIFIGIPPIYAHTTNVAAVIPGHLGALLGYKKILVEVNFSRITILIIITSISAILGSYVLINTPENTFSNLAPWLLLITTILFIISPRINKKIVNNKIGLGLQNIGLIIVSTYGGFFNGGLGIALISILSLNKKNKIHEIIAIKSVIALVVTLTSVVAFAYADFIRWEISMIMIIFTSLGGYFGARLAQNLSQNIIRSIVIFIGLTMSILLFINI